MTDSRSPEARAYRRWYNTKRWRATRLQQLRHQPLCSMCLQMGRTKAADTVDHVRPHRGDAEAFWDTGNLQSLCSSCHSSHKQAEESGSTRVAVGVDGWPIE